MSLYSDRRYSIHINDNPLREGDGGTDHQMRVVFQIATSFGGSYSFADIALYNLAPNSVNKFFEHQAVISLSAGYVNSSGVIFKGGITNVLKEREGPSTITRILATSGSTDRRTINHTMPTGSTVPQTIRKLGELWGFDVDMKDSDFDKFPPYQRKSLQGTAALELSRMARAHGFYAVMEKGKIVVILKDGKRAGANFIISQDTGMEGIPEISEQGCDVAVRIDPQIVIGSEFKIDSKLKTYNYGNLNLKRLSKSLGEGVYTVKKMDHSGDSWGDAWTTKITGKRLSA